MIVKLQGKAPTEQDRNFAQYDPSSRSNKIDYRWHFTGFLNWAPDYATPLSTTARRYDWHSVHMATFSLLIGSLRQDIQSHQKALIFTGAEDK